MNFKEAIKYLKDDITNAEIVTDQNGRLYKIYEGNLLSKVEEKGKWEKEIYGRDQICINIDTLTDGKFEIYKESRLLNFKEACIQMSNGKKVKNLDNYYTVRLVDDGYYFYGDVIFKNAENLSILEVCELIDRKFEVVE